IEIENVKSFKSKVVVPFDESFNILIGSNGSGKSNLLVIITLSIKHFFLTPYTIQQHPGGLTGTKSIIVNHKKHLRKDLEKYIGSENIPMKITFRFVITPEDITNISTIKAYEYRLREILSTSYPST